MFGFRKKKTVETKITDDKLTESQQALIEAAITTADAANAVTSALKRRLEDAVAQFEYTIRIMTDALLICDESGTVMSLNPAAEATFGAVSGTKITAHLDDDLCSDILDGIERRGFANSTSGRIPVDVISARLDRQDRNPVVLVLVHPSDDLFKPIFEHHADGILIVQDGVIVAANTATSIIFGYNNDELLGKPLDFLFGICDPQGRVDGHTKTGHETALVCATVTIPWAGGDATLVSVRPSCAIDPISEPEFICVLDRDLTITFANETYARHIGKTRNSLIGRSIADMVSEEHKTSVIGLKKLTPQQPSRRLRLVEPTGSQDWFDNAVFDGDTLIEYQRIGKRRTE